MRIEHALTNDPRTTSSRPKVGGGEHLYTMSSEP